MIFMSVKKSIPKIMIMLGIMCAVMFTTTAALAIEYYLTQPLQVPDPNNTTGIKNITKVSGLDDYFPYLVNFLLGFAAVATAVTIVIAGVRYATSYGNESAISEAKGWIWDALTGLGLALASYLILYTINPDLINLKLTLDDIPVSSQTSKENSSEGTWALWICRGTCDTNLKNFNYQALFKTQKECEDFAQDRIKSGAVSQADDIRCLQI